MRHVMSSFKTGQSASIRRRLDEADKQRWMGHGNTLSHEKKMEAIVKGMYIPVEVLTNPVTNLPS